MRIVPRDFFGFAEYQEKATQRLGYKGTLTRHIGNSVLNKANATNKVKIKNSGIEWYVPHCTRSMEQQKIISKQI